MEALKINERKDYKDFSKEELVKEANILRIYLERFIENCKYHEQQGQLVSSVLESDLSIRKY